MTNTNIQFLTKRSEAGDRYAETHSIDPRTGGVRGPLGLTPQESALDWQQAHDQAVWNVRNSMAQDAFRFAQGAQGLLTSSRAGGGQALQSNIYGSLANLKMQQASMMQPIDLLSDYRRHVAAQAGKAGRTETTIGAVLQGLGAVASVIPGGQAIGLGLMGAGGAIGGIGANKAQASYVRAGASVQGAQGGQSGFGGLQAFGQAMQQYTKQTQQQAQQPEAQGGAVTPKASAMGAPAGGGYDTGGGGASQSTLSPEGGFNPLSGDGQQGAGGAGADSPGGPEQARMGGGMGGPSVVGGNGDFSPVAYAANGAMSSPVPEYMQVALSEHLAVQLQEDPTWQLLNLGIDRELKARMELV